MRKEVKLLPLHQRCQTEIQFCISTLLKHAGASSAEELMYSVPFADMNEVRR